MNDEDIASIGDRLRASWAAIIDTERHRGDVPGGDAQEAYQAALLLFRHAQIEAFTATLGAIPLLQEQVDALTARVAALEAQPVTAPPRAALLGLPLVQAADAIADAAGPELAEALMAWAELLVERLDGRNAAALAGGLRRLARAEQRQDIADRVIFHDPLSPY